METAKILEIYFLSNGIISNEKYSKYEPYLRGIIFTNDGILVLGLLIGFSRASKIVHKIQIVSVLCCVTGVLIFKIFAHVYKKYLLRITSRLQEESKFGIEQIANKFEIKMKKTFLRLLIGVFFSFFILFNVTFLAFLTKPQISYNDMDIYVVPELFIYSSVDSFGEYLQKVWLQTAFFFPEMMAYLSLTMYTCYVVAGLEVHVEEIYYLTESFVYFANLKAEIEMMQQKSRRQEVHRRYVRLTKHLDDEVELKFKTLVQFQQYNFHYMNDFIHFGKWIFNAMLAWFFCTLVLFIYLITQVTEDGVLLIKVGSVVTNFLFVFYILCYSGEVICQMSESTVAQLYNATWYILTPALRKQFSTLMLVTRSHVTLKAFNMYIINMDLYSKTLKIVFSVVNGIMLMQKKIN